ncbi:MAG: hypothetical protein RIS70_3662, partial [Planctomycetota bacterium]
MYPRMALQLNTSPRSYGFYKKFSSGPRPGCAPRMRRQCHSCQDSFWGLPRGRRVDWRFRCRAIACTQFSSPKGDPR